MSRAPSFDAIDLARRPARGGAYPPADCSRPISAACRRPAADPRPGADCARSVAVRRLAARRAHLELIAASIGAWRLAAAAMDDRSPPCKGSPTAILSSVIAQSDAELCQRRMPQTRARRIGRRADFLLPRSGIGCRCSPRARARIAGELIGNRAFARAALANLWSRRRLAAHMERVIFRAGDAHFPAAPFDGFGLTAVQTHARTARTRCSPPAPFPSCASPCASERCSARQLLGWRMIDYHCCCPTATRSPGAYPHFVPYLTPGWLDRACRGAAARARIPGSTTCC